MNKQLQNKKLDELYHKIGLKNNLSREQVRKIVESPYEFAKLQLDELKLKDIEDEETFINTKTNFIFKYLGKLHTDYKLIKGRQKQSDTFKQLNKKRWEKK